MVAERLATGLLAASVAHEINNPLTALLTNLELLEAEVQSELVTESREAAAHIRTVVQDLRSISREDQQAPVSLKPLVEAAVRMTRHLVTARAHLQLHLAEVPVILGNPGRLTQVFINLLLNAAQAIPQGAAGQHTVSVATSVVGDEVICEVADTGVGIPPDQLHSLFAAFFTTKEDGVGLGLSIAHKVVTDLGGAISVTSIVGQGTRFTVRFPRAP